jgi:hypothetical protein
MVALIIFIILLAVPVLGLFIVMITDSLPYIVYDVRKVRPIINQYSGSRSMRILRALSDGTLQPSDIRHYYNYGKSGTWSGTLQEYRLIRQLADRGECDIVTKHSGCNHSFLGEVELKIKRGKAVITKYWYAG